VTDTKKPSEQIGEALPATREAIIKAILGAASAITGCPWDAEMRAEFEASPEGKQTLRDAEVAAIQTCTLQYLDAEHERRAAFEQYTLERLWALEQAAGVRGNK
jgi:hypothetical protein